MDNQDNAVQIPDLKLANVGDRRRKKSGLAWWSTKGGSTSGSIGARGVLGGLRGLAGALSAGKVAVALLVAALSAGAYGLGKALAPNDSGFLAHGKSQLFVARAGSKYDGDLSNLPGTQRSAQSGLNMVSGSLDGMTPEEREAKAKSKAEAEAEAAKAAADAQANANAGAAPTMPGGSGDYVDPEALAAAGKGKGAGMEHSFGKLSSGLGGGLSGGGGGLSGGVSRPFENTIKSNGESGKLLAMRTNRTLAATAARPVSLGRNSGRGLAQRQLNTAAMLAPSVKSGANETRSASASIPFDAGTAAAPLITGSGAQTAGAGQASPSLGSGDAAPGVNAASGNGSPVSGSAGAATTSTVDDCTTLAAAKGWKGQWVNSPAGGCVQSVTGTGSQDTTNTLVKVAKYLIDAAAIIAALQAVASLLWLVWPGALAYSKYLGYMLTALGAAIGGIGFTLAGMGRPELGLIYGITGGVIAAASFIGVANLMSSSIIPAITGTITGCLSLLDAGVANNTFGINKALFGKNISAPTTTSTSTSSSK